MRVVVLTARGKISAPAAMKTFASKGEQLPDLSAGGHRVAADRHGLALLRLKAPSPPASINPSPPAAACWCAPPKSWWLLASTKLFRCGARRYGTGWRHTVTLTQLVGLRKALEILLTNPTLTAQDAKDIGLVPRSSTTTLTGIGCPNWRGNWLPWHRSRSPRQNGFVRDGIGSSGGSAVGE